MKLPVLFLGHGNPMNAIEHTVYSESWQRLGKALRAQYGGKIRAILAVSAHWVTRGSAVTAMEKPRTIHDFGGFPQALFDAQYPAPGSPEVAAEIRALLGEAEVAADLGWGLDHGTWSVLGMEAITFGEGRKALRFGCQKINLHQLGAEVLPNAARATTGSADLCLLTDTPLPQVLAELAAHQIEAISDIVPRTGAVGAIESVYLRDPDGNLLEISRYLQP